jgi:hypothetical protein
MLITGILIGLWLGIPLGVLLTGFLLTARDV